MTKVTVAPALPKTFDDLLAADMWGNLGGRYYAVIEVEVVERTEPADEEDKEPSCKVRVTSIEVASATEQVRAINQQLQAMYARRTKAGTLDDV